MNEPLQPTPVSAPAPVARRSHAKAWVALAVVLAAVCFAAGVYAAGPLGPLVARFAPALQSAGTKQPAGTATKTYTNPQFGFSFTYPESWFQTNATSTLSATAFVGVGSHDPSQPYSDLSQPEYGVSIEVYPIEKLHFSIDPSAWVDYSTSTGQWVRSDCADFNSGCTKVTKTALGSNITVGGIAGYQLVGYNPGYILVPLKNGFGLSLFFAGGTPSASTIDPVLQQVLNSFTFQ